MIEGGFYWVRLKASGFEPVIGCLSCGVWWLTGNEAHFDPAEIDVLGDRLSPPVLP